MTPLLSVFFSARAAALLRTLTDAQRAQVARLATAISMAPRAGAFYGHDTDNRALLVVSASDVHLIYTITYRVGRDSVFIVNIVIDPWIPGHVDMP